ncbi:MAG: TraB/GumN family protein [Spirochaetales bacterium]|nr:TraB/GumN family protein [Spirochaetales bacterium]
MTTNIESDSISRVKLAGKEIILVGTAHVSSESVNEVDRVIREEKPDRVCVEIDASRYKTMTEGQKWENLNIGQVLRKGQGFLLLSNLVLSSFQKRMGSLQGTTPGDEMKMAINTANELNVPFTFSDRDIQITLRRAWKRASLWQKMKMIAALLSSFFSKEELTAEEIEKLKKKSAMQDMMDELADYLPSVKEILIDERDRFLASSIFSARGEKVVAVIGAAHAGGIIEWFEKFERGEKETGIDDINHVPPPAKYTKFLPWIIPVLVVGLLAGGFIRSGAEQGLKMILVWVLSNGILSAIGAIIALAHPLTVIISFLAAPLTSLNPTIGVGIVTGLLEYYLRKPKVKDFETLSDDLSSVKGFYRNRLTHILIVFFLSSVGSSIGTFVAFPYIAVLFS